MNQRYVEEQSASEGQRASQGQLSSQGELSSKEKRHSKNRMFVPFSEDLLAAAGSPLGDLVPFQLEYRCVRLLDGTYEFSAPWQPQGSAAA